MMCGKWYLVDTWKCTWHFNESWTELCGHERDEWAQQCGEMHNIFSKQEYEMVEVCIRNEGRSLCTKESICTHCLWFQGT